MKVFIIFGIVLLILVGGVVAYFQFSKTNQNSTPSPAPTQTQNQTQASATPSATANNNVTTPNAAISGTVFTLADVAAHSTAQDCWMVIEGKVYDVTTFIPNHPGGEVIVMGCGKDATTLFNKRPGEGTPHPEQAQALLPNYLIGTLQK